MTSLLVVKKREEFWFVFIGNIHFMSNHEDGCAILRGTLCGHPESIFSKPVTLDK